MLWITLAYAQGLGSFVSPGPLAEVHTELDTIQGCTECHVPFQGVAPDRCLNCHERVKQQVDTKTGFHATKSSGCAVCHADHRGRDFGLIRLKTGTFDHSETGFTLEGRHAEVPCLDCHTSDQDWTDLSQDCNSCHHDLHGGKLSDRAEVLEDCESCHHTGGWRTEVIPVEVFDHTNPEHTDYVLEYAHLKQSCRSCHFDFNFLPTEHEKCETCHANPHRTHFRGECEDCHALERGWRVPGFDHARTRFPLVGQHQTVRCASCHTVSVIKPLRFERCVDCHTDVHRGQFEPRSCTECHAVDVPDFAIPQFDHAGTAFPLVGQHRELTCEACHGDGPAAIYRPKEHADCDACHTDAHDGRWEPTDCSSCHVADQDWRVGEFDHARTGYPLTGEHADVECEQCHGSGTYRGLQHDSCADCHTETPHPPTLDRPCVSCHRTSGFALVVFAHSAQTGFDLAGRHEEVGCTGCHDVQHDFKGLSTSCRACHRTDAPWGHYDGGCETCHQGEQWAPATLGTNDHAITGFPLTGQHKNLECEDCHPADGARGSTPDTCTGCHRGDDPHRNLLGSQCSDCHATSSWLRTRFRHQRTGWPLVGLHRVAECSDCHAVSYIGTPTDCWRCHEAEASPDIESHQSAFFATCDECHSPYGWGAVRFAH